MRTHNSANVLNHRRPSRSRHLRFEFGGARLSVGAHSDAFNPAELEVLGHAEEFFNAERAGYLFNLRSLEVNKSALQIKTPVILIVPEVGGGDVKTGLIVQLYPKEPSEVFAPDQKRGEIFHLYLSLVTVETSDVDFRAQRTTLSAISTADRLESKPLPKIGRRSIVIE